MKATTLLGAALAGISASAHAATIYNDTAPGSDLGNSATSPTDLSGVFSDFRNMGRVDGSFVGGGGPDFRDHFLVGADPGEAYSIPFSYDGAGSALSVQVYWGPAGNPQLIDSFPFASGSGDSSLDFTLDAIPPLGASSEISFLVTYGEGGSGAVTYEIGSVPEPSSAALLGLGLAGAAMRRKRD